MGNRLVMMGTGLVCVRRGVHGVNGAVVRVILGIVECIINRAHEIKHIAVLQINHLIHT